MKYIVNWNWLERYWHTHFINDHTGGYHIDHTPVVLDLIVVLLSVIATTCSRVWFACLTRQPACLRVHCSLINIPGLSTPHGHAIILASLANETSIHSVSSPSSGISQTHFICIRCSFLVVLKVSNQAP